MHLGTTLYCTVHLDYFPTYTFGSLSLHCNYYQILDPFCRFIPRAYPPLLILPMILGSIRSFLYEHSIYLRIPAIQLCSPINDDVSPILRSRGFAYLTYDALNELPSVQNKLNLYHSPSLGEVHGIWFQRPWGNVPGISILGSAHNSNRSSFSYDISRYHIFLSLTLISHYQRILALFGKQTIEI